MVGFIRLLNENSRLFSLRKLQCVRLFATTNENQPSIGQPGADQQLGDGGENYDGDVALKVSLPYWRRPRAMVRPPYYVKGRLRSPALNRIKADQVKVAALHFVFIDIPAYRIRRKA
jgi:hypothetical protein